MFFILHIVALLCLIRVLIKPLERSTVVVQVHQNKQEHKKCVFLFYFLILCYLLSDKVLWNKVKGAHTVYTSIFIMTSGQNPFKATQTATDHWIRLHHVQAASRLPEMMCCHSSQCGNDHRLCDMNFSFTVIFLHYAIYEL